MRVLGLFVTLVFGALAVGAQAPANRSAMIDHEIKALEFLGGGSPLTGQERATAGQIVDTAMRADAQRWAQTDAVIARFLKKASSGDAATKNTLRERGRYGYAFSSQRPAWPTEYALEKKIIEAHDPVVAIDPARKLVVTAQALPEMRRLAAWAATTYGVAPPRSDFDTVVRAVLQQQFTKMTPGDADLYAHFERRAALAPKFWESVPKAIHDKALVINRPVLQQSAGDPRMIQWRLVQVSGAMAAIAERNSPGSAALGAQGMQFAARQIYAQQMQRAIHSMSPYCIATHECY